jgi:hypothetical protein
VGGRKIPTDPIRREEGIVPNLDFSKASVHIKSVKGRKRPSDPIRREESTVPNLEVSEVPIRIKSVKGRNTLTDPTREEGIVPNPELSKAPVLLVGEDAAAEMCGEIEHPTIEEIAEMVLDYWEEVTAEDPGIRWGELVMWKMDLKGAYTLMDVHPDEVGMFAQELVDGLMYFHQCGVFRWSCTPAAFHVVTRAIKWELRHKLEREGGNVRG